MAKPAPAAERKPLDAMTKDELIVHRDTLLRCKAECEAERQRCRDEAAEIVYHDTNGTEQVGPRLAAAQTIGDLAEVKQLARRHTDLKKEYDELGILVLSHDSSLATTERLIEARNTEERHREMHAQATAALALADAARERLLDAFETLKELRDHQIAVVGLASRDEFSGINAVVSGSALARWVQIKLAECGVHLRHPSEQSSGWRGGDGLDPVQHATDVARMTEHLR